MMKRSIKRVVEESDSRSLLKLLAVALFAISVLIAATGCSEAQDETFTAARFILPAEVQQTMDSVNAFARASGGAASFEEYKAIYTHFIEQNPNSVPLHMDIQTLYNNFGKRIDAQDVYRELYETYPDSAMFIYLYARTQVGPIVDSLYHKAFVADSNFYWSNFALASRIFSYPPYDTARAIELYKRCIKLDNAYPAPFQQLAVLYKAKGDYDKAMEFADLFATSSQNPRTPLLLQADIWEAKGNAVAAQQLLAAYVVENPGDLQARHALADLYERQDSLQQAIAEMYGVARDSRLRALPFMRIAELYGKMGNADSALGYVLAAARVGYDDYYRIENAAEFALLKDDNRYSDLIAFLKEQSEKHTADRMAGFADRADSIKQANLSNTVSEPLPSVGLTTISGESISLEALRGNPAVVLFWSAWSDQSQRVLDLFHDLEELRPEGVKFLLLNMWDDDPEEAEKYLRDRGFDYPVIPVDDFTAEKFGVFGVPTILLADSDGVVRYRLEGYQMALDQIILWQLEALK